MDIQLAFEIGISVAVIVLIVLQLRKHPELDSKIRADLAALGKDVQLAVPMIGSDVVGHLENLRDLAKVEVSRLEAAITAARDHK